MTTRLAISVFFFAIISQVAAQPAGEHYVHIPDSISPEAQAYLRMLPDPHLQPTAPELTEIEQWKTLQETMEARNLERQKDVVERLGPDVTKNELGGVPVLDIKPRNWRNNGKILVYTHGGAYTLQSAASTLGSSALMADATGLRVISIDYTLAPHAKWQEVTDQVVTVFTELGNQGYAMKDIAIYGDSAGGGLAAGSVLKMRPRYGYAYCSRTLVAVVGHHRDRRHLRDSEACRTSLHL